MGAGDAAGGRKGQHEQTGRSTTWESVSPAVQRGSPGSQDLRRTTQLQHVLRGPVAGTRTPRRARAQEGARPVAGEPGWDHRRRGER